MAINKVVFGTETLIDLTGDTVTPEVLLAGYTAHNASGEPVAGAAVIPTKTSELENDSGFLTEQDISDKVSKNGDTINGDLVLETAVGQNTSYAGLEKVNLGGMDLACQTVGVKNVIGRDAKLAIVISDVPMLCTLLDGEIRSMLYWNADTEAAYLVFSHGTYGELPFIINTKTPTEDTHAANKKYVDDTVSAHSGNTTIHVTADEKSAWNAKADATELAKKQNKVTYGTTDLTAGSSALATGELYFVYE